jgi:hypothetical protein
VSHTRTRTAPGCTTTSCGIRSSGPPTRRGEYKLNPHQLLRFIRNCHAHANQATRPGEDSIFTHRPYFLDLLPGLVVKLWELRASTEVGQVLAQIYRPSLHAHQDMRPH